MSSGNNGKTIEPVGFIHSPFTCKFGIPRQSGLIGVISQIELTEKYSSPEIIRGLGEYSHLWLIWGFSENEGRWSPTVRPPRLGGNKRVGVFATRSPFRPNNLGLSSVELVGIENAAGGSPLLIVSGADLLDGTPVYDIKPYIPYTDCHPDAKGSFAEEKKEEKADVVFPVDLREKAGEKTAGEIVGILSSDPRPHYIDEPGREFFFEFDGLKIGFTFADNTATVTKIEKA